MRNSVIFVLGLIVGIAMGVGGAWVKSFYPSDRGIGEDEALKNVLAHANVEISPENRACEGKSLETVGDVMASLLELNAMSVRNRLSYGCHNRVCTVSISECKPWKDSECNTRILKVDLDNDNIIDASSFTCLDMP